MADPRIRITITWHSTGTPNALALWVDHPPTNQEMAMALDFLSAIITERLDFSEDKKKYWFNELETFMEQFR